MRLDETPFWCFDENRDSAYALRLRTSAWLSAVLAASALVVAAAWIAAVASRSPAVWWIYASFALVLAVCQWLNERKRTREAGMVLSLGFWVATTVAVFFLGGVRGPGAFVYLPIVITAGLFWSWRAAAALAASGLGAVALTVWLDAIDRLPPPLNAPTAGRLLQIFAGSLTMTVFLVGICLHTLHGALQDFRRQVLRTYTLQARLDAHIEQRGRLEMLGLLAGGVTHDFNNLMTVILSLGSVLERQLPADSPARTLAGEINHSAVRAAELAQSLLKAKATPTEVIDLGRALAEFEPILSRIAGGAVTLSLRLNGRPSYVKLARTDLERIVTNLVINARDAMPHGGQIVVALGSTSPDESGLSGRMVELSVADTGVGLDEAARQRIFEPFYTTKGPAGTGLGLATVETIVTRLEGRIFVEGAPGRGTKIRILLPEVGSGEVN